LYLLPAAFDSADKFSKKHAAERCDKSRAFRWRRRRILNRRRVISLTGLKASQYCNEVLCYLLIAGKILSSKS
jgi:hypothetical protein